MILALSVRAIIIWFHNFDGLYGQDAFAYYDFAGDLLHFVRTRQPPPPFFWTVGYPLQLAVGMRVLGSSEYVALSISMILGAILPVLVYIIGLQIKLRPPYAFFAGLLMAFSGQALQSSLVIMSDVPALFWGLISLSALLQYLEKNNRLWLVMCGFALSFACLTRSIYLILPPLYLVIFLIHWKLNIRLLDIIISLIAAIPPLIPQVIYNQVNPTTLLNHSWLQGWSPLNAFLQDFVNIDGTFHYEKINALFYAYPTYDLSYLSPLLTVFVILGLVVVLRQRNRNSLILLAWLILPYLFLAGIPYQNIRFALIFFPAVAIFVGIGLQAIVQVQNPLRWIALGLVLIGFGHTAINGFDYANSFVEQHQSEKQVINWLTDKVPEQATLYTFGSTLTLRHYTDYNVIEIFYETPDTLKQRWFKGRTDYVLLNVWQIENQWQGHDPQANYHWFRDERGLTVIDKYRNLTLFEANP